VDIVEFSNPGPLLLDCLISGSLLQLYNLSRDEKTMTRAMTADNPGEPRNRRNERYKKRLMVAHIRDWQRELVRVFEIIGIPAPMIVDVGAAEGAALLAAFNLGNLGAGYLVDSWWHGYYDEYLKYYKFNQAFYKSKNIEVLPVDAQDASVPLTKADIVIKTWCQGPYLADILPRTNAKWFLTCDSEREQLGDLGLEVVHSFHLCTSKRYQADSARFWPGRYPYLLLRRK
jgi:hypothetical protein